MKLSDYVIDFLARRGISHVFGISGGAAVHLFDSAAKHPTIGCVFSQHEQSSAMSADGYARVTGKLGVALTTSGPGATNLLTGVCCSYYDSVPTLMITGQVATHRLKGERAVRQVGFQETDVVSIFASVTKYAHQIRDPSSIRYQLEKACHTAFSGRPGPVLIDLPDDLQRAEVDPTVLEAFLPEAAASPDLRPKIDQILCLLRAAERPVLILGQGLSTPRVGPELSAVLERLGIPIVLTWAGLDLVSHDHPLRVGPFGVYGPRLGNFTVQNSDFLLCLGTRLSQNVTGGILPSFARRANIVMVDACEGEMDKFDGRGIDVRLRINAQLKDFVSALDQSLVGYRSPAYSSWKSKIREWKGVLPDDIPSPSANNAGFVDAYDFVSTLSKHVPADEPIFADTGGNLTWMCNGFRIKKGQRLMSAWNNTPMGYALPAAIGAAAAIRPKSVTCVTGDGGLVLCLGELATIARHRLPLRVILMNNHCHGIQKQTLETWLGAHYVGVDEASGLAFPPFARVCEAMGLETLTISASGDIDGQLREAFSRPGPVVCNVEIDPGQKLYPVTKFGFPLENQMPFMREDLLRAQMLIEPFSKGDRVPIGTAGV